MSIDPKLIQRINELAQKKKTIGLTEEEAREQTRLRKEYLQLFRQGFQQELENIKVVDSLGNDVTPNKIKEMRNKQ